MKQSKSHSKIVRFMFSNSVAKTIKDNITSILFSQTSISTELQRIGTVLGSVGRNIYINLFIHFKLNRFKFLALCFCITVTKPRLVCPPHCRVSFNGTTAKPPRGKNNDNSLFKPHINSKHLIKNALEMPRLNVNTFIII